LQKFSVFFAVEGFYFPGKGKKNLTAKVAKKNTAKDAKQLNHQQDTTGRSSYRLPKPAGRSPTAARVR
jgi:hypothetical protein